MAKKPPVKKTSKRSAKPKAKALPYVICRGSKSGVHAGELVSRNENGYIILRNARRLWRFNGAQTLSEVAVYGLSKDSRVAPVLERQELQIEDVSEIIHCQPAGRAAIEGIAEWRA